MEKSTFFATLRQRLNDLNVSEENINKYIRQFERYFNTMSEEEAADQIESFDGVEGIAANILRMIQKKEAAEQAASAPPKEDPPVQPAEEPAPAEEPTPSAAAPIMERTLVAPAVKLPAKEAEEALPSPDENPAADEATRENDIVSPTKIDLEAVKNQTAEQEMAILDELEQSPAISPQPEPIRPARREVITTQLRGSTRSTPIVYPPVEEGDNVNFNELYEEAYGDDEENEEGYEDEFNEKIPSTLLYWVLVLLTSPISLAVFCVLFVLFITVFAAMAVIIVVCLAALIALIIAGTAFSLIGIIYGITQLFSSLPTGLFELGLGVVIGGSAMLVGILLYNFAVRLLPWLMQYWTVFAKFVLRKIGHLYRTIKKECAKR